MAISTKHLIVLFTETKSQGRNRSLDLFLLIIIWSLGALGSGIALFGLTNPTLTLDLNGFWFDADCASIVPYFTSRVSGEHWRSANHPLISLLIYPLVTAIRFGLHTDHPTAVSICATITGGIWPATLYILLRLMTCRPVDAVVFSLLGVVSAGTLFWLTVVETYALSSISILAGLIAVHISLRSRVSERWLLMGSLATFAITITNWVIGISAALLFLGKARAVRVLVWTLIIVGILWSVELAVFPYTSFPGNSPYNRLFVRTIDPRSVVEASTLVLLHSVVMPNVMLGRNAMDPSYAQLTIQHSPIGSSGSIGTVATIVWVILLLMGITSLVTATEVDIRKRALLGIALLGQLILHSIYGQETFLYAANATAILIPIVAVTTQTTRRRGALTLACGLLVLITINNMQQFRHSVELLRQQSALTSAG